jgi:hypothetical protein
MPIKLKTMDSGIHFSCTKATERIYWARFKLYSSSGMEFIFLNKFSSILGKKRKKITSLYDCFIQTYALPALFSSYEIDDGNSL